MEYSVRSAQYTVLRTPHKDKVSVIVTVKNEGQAIRRLLDSLVAQTRLPDEVVIVDGGSTDNTVEIIQRYAEDGRLPLRLLVRPGANISAGRNAAINAAQGEIIASTDAGVRLSPRWLEELTKPFDQEGTASGDAGRPMVVSGFFLPDPQTAFETAMGATVLPAVGDVVPRHFLPSSRSVAFRKEAWEAVGGYPEWLDYCEDLIFDFRLRDRYGPFPFVPEALAYFRPRSSLRAFLRQYYRYARGDGKADLWRKRHAVRYLAYLGAGSLLLALAVVHSPWWLLGIGAGAVAMLWTPYRRLWTALRGYGVGDKVRAILWVPVIRITGDLAKMIGYPVGWAWRLQRLNRQPEIRWR
jgi:glycosyltransferase involved in cell wall biosynthesis